ncbi:MAG: Asp-tRNA(Asn)/Glu-tRNA(Gln) amidotransferase subunit GatA [Tissierellia bacterium]|nr:Asp-tRNA(Asn)/Glu-tRNA(Gln) amidotransferase subunit GatA [Tissierellia bacterium]
MRADILREKLVNNEIDIDKYYEDLIKKVEDKKSLNIFISFDENLIKERIEKLKNKKNNNEKLGKLFGVPVSLKDNISYTEMRMTCGSKMLEDFTPVFNATVVEKLLKEDAVIFGKVNMDEFAMGSSSETSYYGVTKNPLDEKLIPGGSSSGSAVSVAADLVPISLGTDTGGSVRQPAAFCNVVGYYPSYGTISRHGVVSMANTLDQVGIVANSVKEVVDTVNIIGGKDLKDMNTTLKENLDFNLDENYTLKGKKIGIVDMEEFGMDETTKADYEKAIEDLKNLGAEIVELEFDYLKYSSPVYNVVMSCEASSNLSRFDGIRYGYLTDDYKTTRELYVNTRSEGFGEEVQRRIAMGTHYLSADNGKKLYKQGLKVRRLLMDEFNSKFDKVDFIATPTVTELPYEIGSRLEDPLAVYDSGTFNVAVNLAGLCAISVPVREGISGSLQFIGKRNEDEKMLNAAYAYERRDA